MIVQHNMSSVNAAGRVSVGEAKKAKSVEKLSSGYRINRSADDAAGLTISEKMRWQIRGLNRASDNAKDGISYIQTAEGALSEMHSMMGRCKELCVQAANDTNTEADRKAIQEEIDQITKEVDRIANTTQYNTLNVFSKNGVKPLDTQSVTQGVQVITVSYEYIDKDGNVLLPNTTQSHGNDASNYSGDQATMAAYIADQAGKAAQAIMSAYPSLAGGSSSDLKVGLKLANIDGANGTLASASLSLRASGSQTEMTYTLNVDTSDYNIGNYNDGRLAATIAHEMTHLVMQDVYTSGMLGQNSEPYPLWFIEGMAQTASGDNGWLSNSLNASSTESDIKTYLSQVSSMPYGAGYLGVLYLGQMASGSTSVSTSSLRGGIDKILGKLVEGYTLSQVINEVSGGKYANYSAFQSNVKDDADAIQFTRDFIGARGADGAGSVVADNLTTEVEDILSGKSAYSASYRVDTTTTSYTNVFGSGFTFPDKGNAAGSGTGTTGGITLGGDGIKLQVGSLSGQLIELTTFDASADALFDGKMLDVMSFAKATGSIAIVDDAISAVSFMRSYYGAVQNRLEHTIANLDNSEENTQGAESKIRDTDIAEEMVAYSSANIITQAAQSMLAQANRIPEGVLQLLEM